MRNAMKVNRAQLEQAARQVDEGNDDGLYRGGGEEPEA
jgi:hypothetical protein